jgi:hypothetical protein
MKGDYGIKPTQEQVDTGVRLAKCIDCGEWVVSDPKLPMFQVGRDYDYFYCGCRGWS